MGRSGLSNLTAYRKNGTVIPDAFGEIGQYTIDLDATPYTVLDNNGASGSITVLCATRPRSMLTRDHEARFHTTSPGDTAANEVLNGYITSVQNGGAGVTQIAMDMAQRYFNIEVTARPRPSVVTTWQDTFMYWLSLAGITNQQMIQTDIAGFAPIYPGFQGNLWDNIKQFCAAHQIYITYRNGNLFITRNRVRLKHVGVDSSTHEVTQQTVSKKVTVSYYNYKQVTNGVFFKADQVYSLAAGEVQVIDVDCNGTPLDVNQPQCVSGITPYPYTSGAGQYVITGSDGYIVSPAYWADNGGSITVTLHPDNANQVRITMRAPNDAARAPFRVSEGAADRPALYVTGAGVTSDPKTLDVPTGYTGGGAEEATTADNKFVIDKAHARNVGHLAAQRMTGGVPQVSMSTDAVSIQRPDGWAPRNATAFVGQTMRAHGGMYRVTSMSLSGRALSMNLEESTTIADFNAVWAGKTFADFNTALDGVQFNEHATAPLMLSAP